MPKLSVVVPVYNVSKYLPKCLNTLTNQSFKDIEIILVNDASPDPEDDSICTFFSKKDDRIKYITHQENRGLGGARNTGIKAATSEYVGFVDSDDWVELDMFEKLYKAIRKKDADISQCYFMEHKGGLSNVRKLKRFRKKRDILNATNVLFWNKLFRKELFTKNNIFFPEKHSLEDLATMPRLLYHVESMAHVKEPLYHYIVTRLGALTANYNRIFADHSVVFNIIKEYMKHQQVWDRDRPYFEKRVLKSLLHDVKRFAQDDLFTEKEKNKVLNLHLHKSLTFLEKPEEIVIESIDLTEQSLRNYKWKLGVKSLLKVV
ncbi:glycosyltransferase family 2 protein [Ekhidna sp. MALMAid0563]|uniref:glycosyltransferase family 2 protein n=1 Tax=Ekhidna sp. MALMAid0563 TaxID=3143937 RepID=UPI0032DEBAA2